VNWFFCLSLLDELGYCAGIGSDHEHSLYKLVLRDTELFRPPGQMPRLAGVDYVMLFAV